MSFCARSFPDWVVNFQSGDQPRLSPHRADKELTRLERLLFVRFFTWALSPPFNVIVVLSCVTAAVARLFECN